MYTEHEPESIMEIPKGGYPLDSGDRPGKGMVGRSPWTARDAHVPLPEAEAGASARARAPAPRTSANCTNLSQPDSQFPDYSVYKLS